MSEPCHDTGIDQRICPCTWCHRIRSITPATILSQAGDSRGVCPPGSAPFYSDTGPALLRQPTLASGCNAHPPAGPSGGGTAGLIIAPRMDENGETSDRGKWAGIALTVYALAVGAIALWVTFG